MPRRSTRTTLSIVALALAPALARCGGATIPEGARTDPPPPSACLLQSPIAVADATPDSPTYAIEGCRIAWVERGSGRILARSLRTGDEATVAPASADAPRRLALGGSPGPGNFSAGFFAVTWEQGPPGKTSVWIAVPGLRTPKPITGPFDHAGEPALSIGIRTDTMHAAVAFTGWKTSDPKGDTDVFVYDLETEAVTILSGGPGQQRFPGAANTVVVVSDFSEDPDGRWDDDGQDVADLAWFVRIDGTSGRLERPGLQAFGVPSGGALAYVDRSSSHSGTTEVRTYHWEKSSTPDRTLDAFPGTSFAPRLTNGLSVSANDASGVAWSDAPNGRIWSASTESSTPKALRYPGPVQGPPRAGGDHILTATGAPGAMTLVMVP